MASLLTLPRELRDQIIDLVITARIPSPPPPASIDTHPSAPRFLPPNFNDSNWPVGRVAYLVNPEAYRPNAFGLLLANLQLHSETLSRLTSVNPALELDVKVVCEHRIWPTWTRIPVTCPSGLVDVQVTVQACGKGPEDVNASGWREGRRGTPSALGLSFTALLARFLRIGPLGPISVGPRDKAEHANRNIIINDLRVNVVPPDAESGASGERSSAAFIAHAIAHRVRVLTSWYPVKYGELAYQRINRILISADGMAVQVFDLAQQLRFVPHLERAIHFSDGSSSALTGPGFENAGDLDVWWRAVRTVRIQNGLDAPDESALVACDEEQLMDYRKEIQR